MAIRSEANLLPRSRSYHGFPAALFLSSAMREKSIHLLAIGKDWLEPHDSDGSRRKSLFQVCRHLHTS
jgi:hypothetical protein